MAALPKGWWIAALAALAAVVGAAAAALLVRRQRRASRVAPPIALPSVASAAEATGEDPLRYLKVEIEAVRLSRSLMATTLTYRLALSNRSPFALRDIAIDGDLTSAHGQAPIVEQLADLQTELPLLHRLDHLGAGQRKSFSGELRLELKHVRPIRQGKIPIYVPLVRLRASVGAAHARSLTFVVGKVPDLAGARMQPFRLDTPPQSFTEIDARPLG